MALITAEKTRSTNRQLCCDVLAMRFNSDLLKQMFILCQSYVFVCVSAALYHSSKTIYPFIYPSIYLSQSSVIFNDALCVFYLQQCLPFARSLWVPFRSVVVFSAFQKIQRTVQTQRLTGRASSMPKRLVHHSVLGNKFGFQLQLSRSSEQIGKMGDTES